MATQCKYSELPRIAGPIFAQKITSALHHLYMSCGALSQLVFLGSVDLSLHLLSLLILILQKHIHQIILWQFLLAAITTRLAAPGNSFMLPI